MADDTTGLSAHKAIAKAYLNALGALDVETAAQMMHADYRCFFPNIIMRPDTLNGAELLDFIAGLGVFLKDGIRFEFLEFTAEDDRVSVVARGNATTVEDAPYNNNYHFLLYFQEQKIIRHVEFYDTFLSARVMGPLMKKKV